MYPLKRICLELFLIRLKVHECRAGGELICRRMATPTGCYGGVRDEPWLTQLT
jgi:hypothetical protein